MRATALMVTATFLTGLALAPAWGQEQTVDGKQVLTARYADAAPAIDGQMTAGEWNAAAVVQIDFDSPATAPGICPSYMFLPPESRTDLSFDIYALYDNENLYVAVRVTDDPNFNLEDELTLLEEIWIEKLHPFDGTGYNTERKIRQA